MCKICLEKFEDTNEQDYPVCKECRETFTKKQINIYKQLEKSGPSTRTQLVSSTNIARSTLFDNLTILKQYGVVEKKRVPIQRGRPLELWSLV
jgi:predicted transcriptional regulator